MGSGAGKDRKSAENSESHSRNKIFLDEGVGIENS